jgi:hypothetical protein
MAREQETTMRIVAGGSIGEAVGGIWGGSPIHVGAGGFAIRADGCHRGHRGPCGPVT